MEHTGRWVVARARRGLKARETRHEGRTQVWGLWINDLRNTRGRGWHARPEAGAGQSHDTPGDTHPHTHTRHLQRGEAAHEGSAWRLRGVGGRREDGEQGEEAVQRRGRGMHSHHRKYRMLWGTELRCKRTKQEQAARGRRHRRHDREQQAPGEGGKGITHWGLGARTRPQSRREPRCWRGKCGEAVGGARRLACSRGIRRCREPSR